MPFDSAERYDHVVLRAPVRTRSRRTHREKAVAILWMLVAASFASEVVWPEAGVLTRIIKGNAVADENLIARSIMLDGRTHRLQFEVAGRKYTVVTPGRALIDGERTAWLRYAQRHLHPLYVADGAFAVDP